MIYLFKAKKLQMHNTKDKRDFPQHAMQVFVRKPCNSTALLPITTKAGESILSKTTLVIVRRGSQGQSWRSKIKKLNQHPVSLLLLFYYYETWKLEEKIQGSLLHSKPLAKHQDNICSSFIHSTNIRWACTEYPILFTVLLELQGRIWWDLYWYRTHNPKRQKATIDHMNLSSCVH